MTGVLVDMAKVAKRSFQAWKEFLTAGIEDCRLTYEQHRAVLDIHPLDDYYFAGVVALEAAKIRMLFASDTAAELLSLLAEHVDASADRNDRVVSDLVFHIISRVELARVGDPEILPHDQVVKAILQRLGIDKVEATQHLMTETLYRHILGEPLARSVPHWWNAFQAKYNLPGAPDRAPAEIRVDGPKVTLALTPTPPARKPRRALAF